LKDGDYTLDQLEMAQHIMCSNRASTMPPTRSSRAARMMDQMDIGKTIEAGIIANIILGDPNANAYVGGAGTERGHSSRRGPTSPSATRKPGTRRWI